MKSVLQIVTEDKPLIQNGTFKPKNKRTTALHQRCSGFFLFMGTPMASALARAYYGGLGAELPAGSRGRDPGQEVRALQLSSFCVSG